MTNAFIPAYSTPDSNRRVLLSHRPLGIPQATHFSLDEVPLDRVSEGQFRVRNIFLSVDPAQRGWANEGTNYSDPFPLFFFILSLSFFFFF